MSEAASPRKLTVTAKLPAPRLASDAGDESPASPTERPQSPKPAQEAAALRPLSVQSSRCGGPTLGRPSRPMSQQGLRGSASEVVLPKRPVSQQAPRSRPRRADPEPRAVVLFDRDPRPYVLPGWREQELPLPPRNIEGRLERALRRPATAWAMASLHPAPGIGCVASGRGLDATPTAPAAHMWMSTIAAPKDEGVARPASSGGAKWWADAPPPSSHRRALLALNRASSCQRAASASSVRPRAAEPRLSTTGVRAASVGASGGGAGHGTAVRRSGSTTGGPSSPTEATAVAAAALSASSGGASVAQTRSRSPRGAMAARPADEALAPTQIAELRKMLKGFACCAQFTDRALWRVAQGAVLRRYARYHTAYHENGDADALYVLLSGTMLLRSQVDEQRGRRVEAGTGAPVAFGVEALMGLGGTRPPPRLESATAAGPCECAVVGRDHLLTALRLQVEEEEAYQQSVVRLKGSKGQKHLHSHMDAAWGVAAS